MMACFREAESWAPLGSLVMWHVPRCAAHSAALLCQPNFREAHDESWLLPLGRDDCALPTGRTQWPSALPACVKFMDCPIFPGHPNKTNQQAVLTQAYLELCPDTVPSPNWAFNAGIGEQSPWNYVPVEILSPGELPANAPFNHTVSFKVTGPPEDLLVAAIRNKCPLEVFHCRRLLKMLKKPEPKQGQGSGKNGGVTKRDLLKALIAYAIPDATPAEANDLLGGILGQKVGGIEEAPEVLLELTSRVEPKEAQHFDKLRKDAVNELQVRAQKARLRGKHQKENKEATDVHGDDAETTTADPPAEPAQPDCEPSSSSKVERPKTLEFDPDAPPAPSAGVPRMPSWRREPLFPAQGRPECSSRCCHLLQACMSNGCPSTTVSRLSFRRASRLSLVVEGQGCPKFLRF